MKIIKIKFQNNQEKQNISKYLKYFDERTTSIITATILTENENTTENITGTLSELIDNVVDGSQKSIVEFLISGTLAYEKKLIELITQELYMQAEHIIIQSELFLLKTRELFFNSVKKYIENKYNIIIDSSDAPIRSAKEISIEINNKINDLKDKQIRKNRLTYL